jgi:serine/threonine-protein kinase
MTKLDDWPRVKRVLEEALARDGADRQAYVAHTCGTDSGLRAQVETLLASSAQAGEFLETPAAMLLDPPGASCEQIGRVVSSYQLIARLGAGGMGEVYRARDARLDRDVALKLLPDAFAANADRIARFKREAQLLASLNHSHIGAIYGFEEDAGTYALVLELVEGPTLADRIAQGPLPLDEALPIAREIAEALEAAHEQRIIHRDLKPANIKLRPDGLVKVLDFGLAEAFDPGGAAESAGFAGTAAYMSPEQARGKGIDKRCDIWAFGCVFYEMLTGRRPFEGQDVAEVFAHIVEQEPDFGALPAATPTSIRRLLRRCLEKDRRKRLPDIGVARIEIDDALTTPDEASPARVRPAWIVTAALAGALIAGVVLYARSPPAESPPLVRASIPLEGELDFAVQQLAFAVSPDGTRIVYRTVGGGPLRIRQLHDAQSTTIAGTEDASTPFFSPDGRWLGFFVGQTLKKVSVTGSAVVTITTLPRYVGAQGYRGAAWSDDGMIAFAPTTGAGLFGVSDRGGEAKPLTVIDTRANEAAHRWPHFLPGGKAILYTLKATHLQSFDDAQIVLRSLETGEQHAVAQGHSARYLPTGHLVFARAGALYAMPFDLARLAVAGAPVKVVDGVITHPESGGAQVSISRNGTLVYAAGGSRSAERPLLWVDRSGVARPATDRRASYWWPRVSPDGQRIAVVIDAAFSKIWILDAERGTLARASQLAGDQDRAVWMPDGVHVTFGIDMTGRGEVSLLSHRFDGTGSGRLLFEGPKSPTPLGWSPDGRKLLFRQTGATTAEDVWLYSIDDRTTTPFLQGPANETSASFSPDGRWVAYVSDESGAAQVYVRPVHGPGRSQVSVSGGTAPVWDRGGRELFFAKGDTLFAAPVTLGETFSSGAVQRLFSGPYTFDVLAVNYLQTVNYDVAPDGQRFLVPGNQAPAPHQLELVLNWFEDLNRLVPR